MKNKQETVVINIFAGASCGKSVLGARLYAEMSVSSKFGDVELIQEFAKKFAWEEDHKSLENQAFITKGQIGNLLPVVGKVEYAVTDSPIELGFVYLQREEDREEVTELIHEARSKYNSINILLKREDLPFQDVGRIHNLEESKKVDEDIKDMLHLLEMPYIELSNRLDVASVIAEIEKVRLGMNGRNIENSPKRKRTSPKK